MNNDTEQDSPVNKRMRRFHLHLQNVAADPDKYQDFEANIIYACEGWRDVWQTARRAMEMLWLTIRRKPFMITMHLTIPKREVYITQVFNNN